MKAILCLAAGVFGLWAIGAKYGDGGRCPSQQRDLHTPNWFSGGH